MSTKILLEGLHTEQFRFAPNSGREIEQYIAGLAEADLSFKQLKSYLAALRFIAAYPPDKACYYLCIREQARLEKKILENTRIPFNSDLPGGPIEAFFSWSMARWLFKVLGEKVDIADTELQSAELCEKLLPLLPEAVHVAFYEKSYSWSQVRKRILPNGGNALKWLIQRIQEKTDDESVQEEFYKGIKPFLRFQSGDLLCLMDGDPVGSRIYCHRRMEKKIDVAGILSKAVVDELSLSLSQAEGLLNAAKIHLLCLCRETDAITEAKTEEVRCFLMGRGIYIALFSARAEKRAPLDSYLGFMLFKNGQAMAYGGAWMFGYRAKIGVNVFPAFRGGESALVFSQIMRLYKQLFGVLQFVVEPYQFGKGNPEGIQTAAFWFYYKLGFRPMHAELNALATKEHERMLRDKKYRSSESVLREFCASNLQRSESRVSKKKDVLFFEPEQLAALALEKIRTDFAGDWKKAFAHFKKNWIRKKVLPKEKIILNKLWPLFLLLKPEKEALRVFIELWSAKAVLNEVEAIKILQRCPKVLEEWSLLLHLKNARR